MTKSKKIWLAAMLLSVPVFWGTVISLLIADWKL